VANEEHLKQIRKGNAAWHAWLRESKEIASLSLAQLSRADLRSTDLSGADLSIADLVRTDLRNATLNSANLSFANLSGADLSYANLVAANLNNAILSGANLTGALLRETVFANVDLTSAVGLETCRHLGPSNIDFRTLERSKQLPLPFLRGVGLSDSVIHYLPSLMSHAVEYYSCFISYSSEDDEFAKRVHADLQSNGVRCWFAPHDLPIGGKILDEIDAAIRLRDKLLLILSEHSIQSDWVEDEVKTAFEEERRRGQTMLFPVRIDDSVMKTKEAWAAKLRSDRNIGDFRHWRNHDEYQKIFQHVLHDLTTKA
jgi:hypothetical protein